MSIDRRTRTVPPGPPEPFDSLERLFRALESGAVEVPPAGGKVEIHPLVLREQAGDDAVTLIWRLAPYRLQLAVMSRSWPYDLRLRLLKRPSPSARRIA